MNRPGWGPILALAGLAVFSFAFTLAAKHGLWPQLPPGALHDTDLWAGLAGGAVLVVLLLRPDKRSDGGAGRRGEADNGKTTRKTNPADEIAPSPALSVSRSETEGTIGADIPARDKRYSG